MSERTLYLAVIRHVKECRAPNALGTLSRKSSYSRSQPFHRQSAMAYCQCCPSPFVEPSYRTPNCTSVGRKRKPHVSGSGNVRVHFPHGRHTVTRTWTPRFHGDALRRLRNCTPFCRSCGCVCGRGQITVVSVWPMGFFFFAHGPLAHLLLLRSLVH